MTDQIQFDPSQFVWTEKYRPKTIDECILPTRVKNIFNGIKDSGSFQPLLLSGSPGIGKTTVAKALCHDMGMDVMVINASNNRGIDVLRNEIDQFATTVSFSDAKMKCVIMDEFDQATPLLQTALRAAIEAYAKNCTFIFSCNFPNKIIAPLHSRFTSIDVTPTKEEKHEMQALFGKRAIQILNNEGIQVSNKEKKGVWELIKKFGNDYRKILNEMQRIVQATGTIHEESVVALSKEGDIGELIQSLKNKDFHQMRSWVAQNVETDTHDLFRKVYDSLLDEMKKESIPNAILIIADYQYKAVTVPNPDINFVAFCLEMMSLEW